MLSKRNYTVKTWYSTVTNNDDDDDDAADAADDVNDDNVNDDDADEDDEDEDAVVLCVFLHPTIHMYPFHIAYGISRNSVLPSDLMIRFTIHGKPCDDLVRIDLDKSRLVE